MGVYLVPELLRAGHEVYVTSRSKRTSNERKVHFVQGDAKDDDFLAEILGSNRFDAIVDFMVYTTEEFQKRVDTLLAGTDHYVSLSSYRVYADTHGNRIDEDSPRLLDTVDDKKYLSTDEYALTKARQENILFKHRRKNWTLIRPAITYSKDRFQLGTMEAGEFLSRALDGKRIIFPREMLDKYATMTWAGDVARMISRLVLNQDAYSEVYIAATAESHKWGDVVKIYQRILKLKIKIVPLEEYQRILGRPYQIKYDRMYDRTINNSKILLAANMTQEDLMPLEDGLRIELTSFSKAPRYQTAINQNVQRSMDAITTTHAQKVRNKLRLRARARELKRRFTSSQVDGAIVTLTVYNNYGNVLQRFALQRLLSNNGLSFTMLDLKTDPVNPKHRNLKKFADKYLTQEFFDKDVSRYFKAYVVGSDQVWRHFSVNKTWEKFSIQFLEFVKNPRAKRVAYAASFGVDTLEEADIDETLAGKIRPLLRKFDAVSVREHSGVGMAKKLGANKVKQVLDPTLLLPASEYADLINASPLKATDSHDVFYYLIQQTPLTHAAISHYEKQHKTEAFGILPYDPTNPNLLPTIEEWLKAIRDAKIVVTDSYHAVAFSIIFHTDFIVFDKQLGGIARIKELLEPLGLADRIVIQGKQIRYASKHAPINWQKVETALKKNRKASVDWLLGALTSNEKQ